MHRVNVGNTNAIGNDRARHRAPAWPHDHVQLSSRVDKVLYNQKIAWETHFLDDTQLIVDAFFEYCRKSTIPLLSTCQGQVFEVGTLGSKALGHMKKR